MTTTFTSEQIIDLLFVDSGKYISLHIGAPGATGANEVTTGNDANYARVASTLVKSLDGTIYRARNGADVVFSAAAGGTSHTVTYICIWDALTAGNCLAVLPVNGSGLPVVAGTVITFAINDIVVRGE
jgi:hypothetical protein